jgi:hypothetical protein
MLLLTLIAGIIIVASAPDIMILFGSLFTTITAIAPAFCAATLLNKSATTSPNHNNLTTWLEGYLEARRLEMYQHCCLDIILNQIEKLWGTGKSMRPGLKAFE